MKESEDWKSKKQYIIDRVREIVPFFVGLAMVTIGGTYYFYTKGWASNSTHQVIALQLFAIDVLPSNHFVCHWF